VAEATDARADAQQSAAVRDLALGQLGSQKPRTLWRDAVRQFRRHRLAVAGTFVLFALILIVLLGPLIWNKGTGNIDFANGLKSPSLAHPFGTDDLGRDLMARVMTGGRISIAVGIVAVIISMTLGTMIGAISGFFGGFVDSALMRFVDMMLSLPTLPLLLLVIYLFRDSMRDKFGLELGMFVLIVGIIGLLSWMPVARLVRASFLSIKEKEFIEAAYCIGATRSSIIFKHILPNALGPVIVAATLGVGAAIITESSLSFLGLGFPPDVPTWGRLLFDNKDWMELAWWMVVFPGMAIFLAVLSINYVGDGLRDALDPHRTTS
jgi:peptide/nickel transport system permease protein